MDQWRSLVDKGFDNDTFASDFILFLEGCGRITPEGYSVTCTNNAYEPLLYDLNFSRVADHTFVLNLTQWQEYINVKNTARREWHAQQQMRSRQQLNVVLTETQPIPNLSEHQRLQLVKEFAQRHEINVGSVPFVRGLVGFLQYQLFKGQLAEWRVSEYVLTQNGENNLKDYVNLLRGVLGLEVIYRDDDNVAITMDVDNNGDAGEQYIVWRMNSWLSDDQLSQILRRFPRQTQSPDAYNLSEFHRDDAFISQSNSHSIWHWIRSMVHYCISILRRLL
ncbi:uncharacterized protein BYT42DRAFT_582160 [Radiomyces spectabilis]|uniref:uncharacterized protein n=1 Tax=Radiomyces spectabilis TaxID=64574 RepID=UPI002220993F|nr:uncharacterized protein BYT42DRAFT_582160 [Radiomyces spectabilis]KAI8370375.1 hypothetical protein BYT42DRAFT_582160 [Radiomyces spectabilis]